MSGFNETWKEWRDNQIVLDRTFEEYKRLQSNTTETQKHLSSTLNAQKKLTKSIRPELAPHHHNNQHHHHNNNNNGVGSHTTNTDLSSSSSDDHCSPSHSTAPSTSGIIANEMICQFEKDCERNDTIQRSLPQPGSFYVRLFLGGTMNVVLTGPSTLRMSFKTEYEEFKRFWTIVMAIWAVVMLFFNSRAVDTLYHLFLIYFYVVLALRENVLKVNGSHIKSWWINHHYLSIMLSITLLTWPYTESYQAFRFTFYLYAVYTATVQLLQYKYQVQRLYTLKTLGAANIMDVPNSDSAQIIVSRSFMTLMPFVFIGQFFQLYNSFFLLLISLKNDFASNVIDWQCPVVGILFFILFFGNFTTTLIIIQKKYFKGQQNGRTSPGRIK